MRKYKYCSSEITHVPKGGKKKISTLTAFEFNWTINFLNDLVFRMPNLFKNKTIKKMENRSFIFYVERHVFCLTPITFQYFKYQFIPRCSRG